MSVKVGEEKQKASDDNVHDEFHWKKCTHDQPFNCLDSPRNMEYFSRSLKLCATVDNKNVETKSSISPRKR